VPGVLLDAQRSPTVSVRPALQTQAIYTQPGEHSQLVLAAVPNVTNPCTTLGSPYINACGFDAGACSKQRCTEHSRGVSPPSLHAPHVQRAVLCSGFTLAASQSPVPMSATSMRQRRSASLRLRPPQ